MEAMVPLLGIGVLAIAWSGWQVRSLRRDASRAPEYSVLCLRDRRIGTVTRVLTVAGVWVAAAVDDTWEPAAELVAGAVVMAAVVGMELWWPRPRGAVRSAGMQRRRVLDYVTPVGAGLSVLALIFAVVVLAIVPRWTAAVAGPDVTQWIWLIATAAGLVATAGFGARLLTARAAVSGISVDQDAHLWLAAVDRPVRVMVVFIVLASLTSAGLGRVNGSGVLNAIGVVGAVLLVLAVEGGRARPEPARRPGVPGPVIRGLAKWIVTVRRAFAVAAGQRLVARPDRAAAGSRRRSER